LSVFTGHTFIVESQMRLLAMIQACRGQEPLDLQTDYWAEAIRRNPGSESSLGRTLELIGDLKRDFPAWCNELKEAGEIVDSLAKEPFEAASGAWSQPSNAEPPAALALLVYPRGADNELNDLHLAVSKWAKRWGLHTAWVLDEALQTLALWVRDPQAHERRVWELPPVDVIEEGEFGPVAGFNPLAESEKEFLSRVGAAAKEHVAALRDSARIQGLGAGPPRSEERTYLWLLRVASLGHSFYAVAGEERRDVKSMREAVQRLAANLHISIPGRPRGRPKSPSPK
jgi:hypothetical protein